MTVDWFRVEKWQENDAELTTVHLRNKGPVVIAIVLHAVDARIPANHQLVADVLYDDDVAFVVVDCGDVVRGTMQFRDDPVTVVVRGSTGVRNSLTCRDSNSLSLTATLPRFFELKTVQRLYFKITLKALQTRKFTDLDTSMLCLVLPKLAPIYLHHGHDA